MDEHRCQNHPDREGQYFCSKYMRYLCEECAVCQDPELYCKFRSGCLIWEKHRAERRGLIEARAQEMAKGRDAK